MTPPTPIRGRAKPEQPLPPLADRERVIEEMLYRYHALATPTGGLPGDRSDDRILTRQHDRQCPWATNARNPCTCWVAAMDELTRCLETMRKLRKQRAVAYVKRRGEIDTADIGVIYQHVVWWYLDVSYRSVPIVRKAGKGRFVATDQLRLIAVRHPDAREEKAVAGVRFLAHLFRGVPRVPGDVVPLLRPTA